MKKLRQLETELGVRTTLGVVSDVAKAVPTRPPHDSEDTEVEDDEKAAGVATTGGAAVVRPGRELYPWPTLTVPVLAPCLRT